jgi:hypothetical protein
VVRLRADVLACPLVDLRADVPFRPLVDVRPDDRVRDDVLRGGELLLRLDGDVFFAGADRFVDELAFLAGDVFFVRDADFFAGDDDVLLRPDVDGRAAAVFFAVLPLDDEDDEPLPDEVDVLRAGLDFFRARDELPAEADLLPPPADDFLRALDDLLAGADFLRPLADFRAGVDFFRPPEELEDFDGDDDVLLDVLRELVAGLLAPSPLRRRLLPLRPLLLL